MFFSPENVRFCDNVTARLRQMCVVTRFRLMTASIVSDLSLKMVDIACSQFFMTRAIMLA